MRSFFVPIPSLFRRLFAGSCAPSVFSLHTSPANAAVTALSAGCGAASIGIIRAQEPAVITVRKSAESIDLAVSPLTGAEGAAATKTLTTDLNLASVFQLSSERAAGAAYTARGSDAAGSSARPVG